MNCYGNNTILDCTESKKKCLERVLINKNGPTTEYRFDYLGRRKKSVTVLEQFLYKFQTHY